MWWCPVGSNRVPHARVTSNRSWRPSAYLMSNVFLAPMARPFLLKGEWNACDTRNRTARFFRRVCLMESSNPGYRYTTSVRWYQRIPRLFLRLGAHSIDLTSTYLLTECPPICVV